MKQRYLLVILSAVLLSITGSHMLVRSNGNSVLAAPSLRPLSDAPWSTNERVIDDDGTAEGQHAPDIAVDPMGNAFAVWIDTRNPLNYVVDVYFAYRPAGGNWGSNVLVNDDQTRSGLWSAPRIAVDRAGNAYAVWDQSPNSSDIYFSFRPAGGLWGPSNRINEDIETAAQTSPAIAVDLTGNAYAVWRDYRNGDQGDIYFSYRPVGGNWEVNERVNDIGTSEQSDPSIAVDANGNAYAVWRDWRDGGGIINLYFAYRPAGGSWGPSVRVSDRHCSQPSIALDQLGNAYVLWQSYFNIYFAYRPAGGDWEPSIRVNQTNTGFSPASPEIAVDPMGNAHAVWSHYDGVYIDAYSAYRPAGGNWGEESRVNDMPNSVGLGPPQPRVAVAVDDAGQAYSVWNDGRSYDIYFAYRPAEGIVRRIAGTVTDGHEHPLGGVFVGLLKDADASYVISTTTAVDGSYSFNDIPTADTYRVRVILRDGSSKEQILYGQYGLLVSAETSPLSFPVGEATVVKDIDFGDPSLVSDPIPVDRLDDLAAMFYHTRQTVDFVRGELGITDFEPVASVWGFAPFGSRAFYTPGDFSIAIGEDISEWASILNSYSRPTNREWHENFHHLMNMTIGMPPFAGGEYSHEGYDNPSTDDSWAEGWAEFWPCVLWDVLGYPNPHLYHWPAIPISFEQNWQVWDYQGPLSREEFAVASLLWDLYDPKSLVDSDPVDVSLDSIWHVIGTTTPDNDLTDMRDVYNILWQADLYNEDGSPVSGSDIDQIFIAHGFYADENADHQWDPGEEVGWGGQPGRRNTPDVPNATMRVHVVDPYGRPLLGSTITVDIKFQDSYYDYSYQVDFEEATGDVHIEPPPPREPVTIELSAQYSVGTSDVYSIDNATYWADVAASTSGYAEEITLVVSIHTISLPLIMKGY